ncbi:MULTISPECIES: class I lanthipeptide [unclassified Chryseobacterium]|jgi:natural product precursor|uniref:class I lanthipeptide n=1 Tax=unclassified Chryseobacterium TaxID=2593645 RepID=UPI000E26C17F|nr:rSAM-modified peptide [Chryseobacterium sp. 5_R23647]
MKKRSFSPLKLDKKTIAKLNDEQLKTLKGGNRDNVLQPGTTVNTSNCTSNSCN